MRLQQPPYKLAVSRWQAGISPASRPPAMLKRKQAPPSGGAEALSDD
jgi:hypothetical protein